MKKNKIKKLFKKYWEFCHAEGIELPVDECALGEFVKDFIKSIN